MEFPLQTVLKDKKLRIALANHGFSLRDNNGVFNFLDFEQETMLKNHRALYDRLYQLGGEELLAELLETGQTCLTEDPKAAKQGVRPIAGTQRFYLKTNNGAPTVLLSILAGIAGWTNAAEDFDPAGVVLKELDGSDAEVMKEADPAGPADEVQEEEDLVFCACGRLSQPPGKCVMIQVDGGNIWRIYSEAQGKCIELLCSDDPSLSIRELAVCEKLTFSPEQEDDDWEEPSEKTAFHGGYRYKLEADGDKWGYINPDFSQVLSPRMDEILFTKEGRLLAHESVVQEDEDRWERRCDDLWVLGSLMQSKEEDPFMPWTAAEENKQWVLYSMERLYARTLRLLGLQECPPAIFDALPPLSPHAQIAVWLTGTELYRLCYVLDITKPTVSIQWVDVAAPDEENDGEASCFNFTWDGHVLQSSNTAIPYVLWGAEYLAETMISDMLFPHGVEWKKKVVWLFEREHIHYYAQRTFGDHFFYISSISSWPGAMESMLTPASFTDVRHTVLHCWRTDVHCLIVEQYGRTGVYDPVREQYVLAVQYDKIDSADSERFKVCLGGLWGLYSVEKHCFVLPCAYDKLLTGQVSVEHGQRAFDWVEKRFNRVLPENCWYVEHLDRQGMVEISPNDVDLIWRIPLE